MSTPEVLTSQPTPPESAKSAPGRKAIFFLLVVSFLNTMGMTILGPVAPFITLQNTSDPHNLALIVAWMTSIYGICQLLAAPGLGLLSDRFGRRPVLFVCLLGSAIGYLLFGVGGSLWILFLGRIIDGLTGGNFSVLFAYLADVTKPEERAKYFGMAGGFSGAGFILGPLIGGLLAKINYSTPCYVAAGVILFTIVWGFFFLPESLHERHRVAAIRLRDLNPLKQMGSVFAMPNLRWLLLAGLLYYLPFTFLISNTAVLLKDSLGWGATEAGIVSTAVGLVDILVQGVLVGKLLPFFGDVKLAIGSLVLVAISYILYGSVALYASPIILLAGVILFAGSGGLVENALRGLTSRMAGPSQQGLVGGAGQAMGSLAAIIGPLAGGLLYVQIGHAISYWSGALIIALAIAAVALAIPSLRRHAAEEETAPTETA